MQGLSVNGVQTCVSAAVTKYWLQHCALRAGAKHPPPERNSSCNSQRCFVCLICCICLAWHSLMKVSFPCWLGVGAACFSNFVNVAPQHSAPLGFGQITSAFNSWNSRLGQWGSLFLEADVWYGRQQNPLTHEFPSTIVKVGNSLKGKSVKYGLQHGSPCTQFSYKPESQKLPDPLPPNQVK